jgi:arsenate reductase
LHTQFGSISDGGGIFKHLHPDRYVAHSAGIEPSTVNPLAIQVIEEVGIDISSHRTKNVKDFLSMELDLVVTVCDQARQTCPFFQAERR